MFGRLKSPVCRMGDTPPARVAKLVDAPGLGPDAFTGVPVRVRPGAPDHAIPALKRQEISKWPCKSKPWKSSNAASR